MKLASASGKGGTGKTLLTAAFAHLGTDAVIINKCDLNRGQSRQIKAHCTQKGIIMLGELPHDPVFVHAMVKELTVTEYQSNEIANRIKTIWAAIKNLSGVGSKLNREINLSVPNNKQKHEERSHLA